MNGHSLDLNLLTVFDALLETRSVSQAGQRLGMSQPSMSYALAKLRESFNDPLFIRINNQMCPTPCATALAPTAKHILELARIDLRRFSGFDLRSTDRTSRSA
jgi:DNA-binding transcriptional LysR family regulator